ncbi:hypothetical protein K503DRAFT_772130 [Rhizopogon vinicolor AM-OR11-026]|uniref:Uncharacterized protein n=1 Tax=Rhizopogon vinicolor AM-OR11-026 TaxID=1314800 RepID=A0A1B7MW60_9AGAM|nr:hypothetical protein K503DRAFT_772130 [Rhizopogon vinicolor AM-OR11-026]
MQDPEEARLRPLMTNGFNIILYTEFSYRVAHFKSLKVLRPLLHIFPNRDTNITKLSTIAKETVLLLFASKGRVRSSR